MSRHGVFKRDVVFFGPEAAITAAREWYRKTSKADIMEALMHKCAASTESYDTALETGDWFAIAQDEVNAVKATRKRYKG